MIELPTELIDKITIELEDVFKLAQVCKFLNSIYDQKYWDRRLRDDYPVNYKLRSNSMKLYLGVINNETKPLDVHYDGKLLEKVLISKKDTGHKIYMTISNCLSQWDISYTIFLDMVDEYSYYSFSIEHDDLTQIFNHKYWV